MKLKVQKRLAAAVLKCSPKRVWFDEDRLSDIKESITKQDLKGLIADGAIRLKPVKSISQGRTRKKKIQKSKGLQKGHGSRKGSARAGNPSKTEWMMKIRVQRRFIKLLREKQLVDRQTYGQLYLKAKGGFFRSKRHIKIYLEEHNLVKKSALEAADAAAPAKASAKKPAKEAPKEKTPRAKKKQPEQQKLQ
jgi:large subunit ribosomal protein L19e